MKRVFDKAALLLAILAIVVAALNYFTQSYSRQLIFDACHYLDSAQLIVKYFCGDSAISLAPFNKELGVQVGNALNLDGPVLPLIGAICLIVRQMFGSFLSVENALIISQIVIHGLNTYLVVIASSLLFPRREAAFLSGLLWAIYPAAIFASGLFLTEALAATLVLAFACLAFAIANLHAVMIEPIAATSGSGGAMGRKLFRNLFLLGLVVGIIVLHKSALLPACLLAAAFLMVGLVDSLKNKAKFAGIVLSGVIVVLSGWFVTTKVVSGKGKFMPNRVASENMALGSDQEVAGWHCMPLPPRTQLGFFSAPLTSLTMSYKSDTPGFLCLELRKIDRLIAHPWNHLRRSILGLSMATQEGWQRLILVLSAMGIILSSCRVGRDIRGTGALVNSAGVAVALSLIAGHLLFVPFESISRYFFSAMPLVTLFASFGLICIATTGATVPFIVLSTLVIAVASYGPALFAHSMGDYETSALVSFIGVMFGWLALLAGVLKLDARANGADKDDKNSKNLGRYNKGSGMVVAAFITVAFLTVLGTKIFDSGAPARQYLKTLLPGARVSFKAEHKAVSANLYQGGLLIDLKEPPQEGSLKVFVNGKEVNGKWESFEDKIRSRPFHGTLKSVYETFRDMSGAKYLRTWYFFALDKALLTAGPLQAEVLLTSAANEIGGHFQSNAKHLRAPSLTIFSGSKYGEQGDGRPIDRVTMLAGSGRSFIGDKEPTAKLDAERMHLYLLEAYPSIDAAKVVDFNDCHYVIY